MALTPHPTEGGRAPQRLPRPNLALRIRILPGITTGVYSAKSRDVSAGAPKAPRIEPRPVNETDFTHTGIAEPGTEFPVQLWHRGVTN